MQKGLGNVLILGDSYSTFSGYIPNNYSAWYSPDTKDRTDVNDVTQTWWHRLMTDTGSNLVLNCSFSGTTICNTGYNGADCKNISFIARMDKLIDSGYFTENSIDTVFIFGGTNDNWAGSPVGELKFENFEIKDLYSVLPAFCYLLIRIKANIQNARVINIINTDLKQEIRENMKIACEKYGVEVIELQDFDRLNGHPSVLGMSQIEKQVLDYLNNAK